MFGCLVVGEDVGCCGGARESREAESRTAAAGVCVLCVVIARKCQGTNRLGRRAKSCRPPSRTTSGTLRIGRERKGKKEEKVERIIVRESVCVCVLRVCGRKREEERKRGRKREISLGK